MGVFTARDPYEGTPARPMSLNGYSWVEGNVVNAVDPSGLSSLLPAIFGGAASNPMQTAQTLNGAICLSNSFECPPLWTSNGINSSLGEVYCNKDGKTILASQAWQEYNQQYNVGPTPPTPNYGWVCIPQGCQQWLEDAYNTMVNSGNPLLVSSGNLLDGMGHPGGAGIPVIFSFVTGGGGINIVSYSVSLPSSYIGSTPTSGNIGLLMHEVWHTTQLDRYTTYSEVEAYNYESLILQAFGVPLPQWRNSLMQYGGPGNVTRNFCSLCQARECMLATFQNNPYYRTQRFINTLTPASCGLCPNLVSRTCV